MSLALRVNLCRRDPDRRTGTQVAMTTTRAIPFSEMLDTGELVAVQTRHSGLSRRQQIRSEPFQQPFLSASARAGRARPSGTRPARSRRASPIREHVLHRVGVSQVTQAVEPDAWRHAAAWIGLGLAVVPRADTARYLRVRTVQAPSTLTP